MLISVPWMTALGVARPMILRTLANDAKIIIGNNTGMSGCVVCAASSILIGKECMIGADVILADNDFHHANPKLRSDPNAAYLSARQIQISDNVFIGTRSIILKGVVIGENTIIGAGSIVTGNIPPNVIAAGNPCRVIRALY